MQLFSWQNKIFFNFIGIKQNPEETLQMQISIAIHGDAVAMNESVEKTISQSSKVSSLLDFYKKTSSVDLFQIVDNTEQVLFVIGLDFGSQRKLLQTEH